MRAITPEIADKDVCAVGLERWLRGELATRLGKRKGIPTDAVVVIVDPRVRDCYLVRPVDIPTVWVDVRTTMRIRQETEQT